MHRPSKGGSFALEGTRELSGSVREIQEAKATANLSQGILPGRGPVRLFLKERDATLMSQRYSVGRSREYSRYDPIKHSYVNKQKELEVREAEQREEERLAARRELNRRREQTHDEFEFRPSKHILTERRAAHDIFGGPVREDFRPRLAGTSTNRNANSREWGLSQSMPPLESQQHTQTSVDIRRLPNPIVQDSKYDRPFRASRGAVSGAKNANSTPSPVLRGRALPPTTTRTSLESYDPISGALNDPPYYANAGAGRRHVVTSRDLRDTSAMCGIGQSAVDEREHFRPSRRRGEAVAASQESGYDIINPPPAGDPKPEPSYPTGYKLGPAYERTIPGISPSAIGEREYGGGSSEFGGGGRRGLSVSTGSIGGSGNVRGGGGDRVYRASYATDPLRTRGGGSGSGSSNPYAVSAAESYERRHDNQRRMHAVSEQTNDFVYKQRPTASMRMESHIDFSSSSNSSPVQARGRRSGAGGNRHTSSVADVVRPSSAFGIGAVQVHERQQQPRADTVIGMYATRRAGAASTSAY